MKDLYFIRHGETFWNVENKICGVTDIGLTENGHNQAIATGNLFVQENIHADCILHSPLIRAKDTAKHIAEMTGFPLQEEPRLIEQNFGKYESTPRDGIAFQNAKKNFCNHYDGGESMFQVAQRIYNLLDEIKSDDKVYILVAHNGIARIIESYFRDLSNEEFASFGVHNCEIRKYTI